MVDVCDDRGTAAESRYSWGHLEGRDKLTKMLIYLLKLIDAAKAIVRKRPTYKMERIASTHHDIKFTSKEPGSS